MPLEDLVAIGVLGNPDFLQQFRLQANLDTTTRPSYHLRLSLNGAAAFC